MDTFDRLRHSEVVTKRLEASTPQQGFIAHVSMTRQMRTTVPKRVHHVIRRGAVIPQMSSSPRRTPASRSLPRKLPIISLTSKKHDASISDHLGSIRPLKELLSFIRETLRGCRLCSSLYRVRRRTERCSPLCLLISQPYRGGEKKHLWRAS